MKCLCCTKRGNISPPSGPNKFLHVMKNRLKEMDILLQPQQGAKVMVKVNASTRPSRVVALLKIPIFEQTSLPWHEETTRAKGCPEYISSVVKYVKLFFFQMTFCHN